MASGLLMLLDDITTILDDVSILTKVAVKKTAGVLGDAVEKSKIAGAIRTDFILSAEIIVIALGTIAESTFLMQAAVLAAVAVVMTVGVYGLVAMIVKLDDLGRHLLATPKDRSMASLRAGTGKSILLLAPYLMRFLSIAGTAAMFLVGGGILVHAFPFLEHTAESIHHYFEEHPMWGGSWLESLSLMLMNAVVGIVAGSIALGIVELIKRFRK